MKRAAQRAAAGITRPEHLPYWYLKELKLQGPLKKVTIATVMEKNEHSVTKSIGKSSITITRLVKETDAKHSFPIDSASEARKTFTRCLDSRLSTMEQQQGQPLVSYQLFDTEKSCFGKNEECQANNNLIAKRQCANTVDIERQTENLEQKRIKIDIEREKRKIADKAEVEKSRAEWLQKKEEKNKEIEANRIKELEAKKIAEELKKSIIEEQVGGKEKYRQLEKAAFHRDEFIKLTKKTAFHLQKFSVIGVDMNKALRQYFPASDKQSAIEMVKQAKLLNAEKKLKSELKVEKKKVDDKVKQTIKSNLSKINEKKLVVKVKRLS